MPPKLRNAVVDGVIDWVTMFPDGRRFIDPDVSVDEDQYMQMWQGYMCAACYEPLDPPFPEVCSLPGCGFHVRDEQRRYMTERFGGYKWVGPSKELVEGLEAPPEIPRPKNSRIWLPGDAA